jgi:hypothetical protein
MKIKSSSRLTLIAISALFIVPLALAWLMFNGTINIERVETHSYGELVQPPVAVDWQDILVPIPIGKNAPNLETRELFSGHWVVMHVVPPACLTTCKEAIRGLRQVHKATGRDQQRVQLALLLRHASPQELADELQKMYPQFELFEYPDEAIQRVFESIASEFSAESSGSSYLIDPIGNIMMFYPAGFDPNDLSKDLKRLLTWSKLDR